ncbi:PorP/SprF family type IX secretion system membrane protein [Marinilabiliaceae bacterium ANBcel2]|nr:PorP/SprF family type IX secretion system membrane protein [Marinilabiliaceae bacterium ANBcel2]
MNKFTLILIISILIPTLTFSQRHFVTNQYVHERFMMNPAGAGSNKECYSANGYIYKQWFGVDNSPATQILTFQAPLKSMLGSGTYIYNDINGNNKKMGFNQAFSTDVTLAKNALGNETTLSFGLAGMVEQTSVDQQNFTGGDIADPTITGGVESGVGFNASTGFILTHNQHNLGFAVTNILPQNNSMFDSEWEPDLPPDFHLHAGTLFKLPRYDVFVEPVFYYRRDTESNSRMDMNFRLDIPTYDDELSFWGILAYRRTMDDQLGKDLATAVTLGLNYKRLNFAFEYLQGLTSAQSRFGNAVMIVAGYRFCTGDRPPAMPCHERDQMLKAGQ